MNLRPVNSQFAELVNILDFCTATILFTAYLSLASIRYLSIFHSSFLDSFDDKVVMSVGRAVPFGISLLLGAYFIIHDGAKEGYMYSVLTMTKFDFSNMFGFDFLLLASVGLTLFTYVRVEHDGFKIRLRELAPEVHQNEDSTWMFVKLRMKHTFSLSDDSHQGT